MAENLDISGSGSSSVATEQLYAAAGELALLAAEASVLGMDLARIDALASPGWWHAAGAPSSMARAERDIDQAHVLMAEIETQARILGWALNSAADGYGFTELMLRQLMGGALGTLAGGVGAAAPRLLGTVAPFAAGAAVSGMDGQDVSAVFSRAGSVDAVRTSTMLADDAMMGLLGVPQPLARVLGDDGLGIVGLSAAASAAMGVGAMFGVLKETPVALASTAAVPVSKAPTGFADRLARVPDPGSNGGAQVVIEKYETPGQEPAFSVYIAGTVTFEAGATSEPWDMTSNMANAVGPGSGSYDSVVQAMAEAGITESSEVQFTGYSQGGGTAAQLVASGDYNAVGLVTFGGPTGQVELPDSVPTVIVEHRDDLVPALGGTQQNLHAVIVQRDVFEGRDLPEGEIIPAHHRPTYEHTAALMDAATDANLAATLARLDTWGSDPRTSVTATAYEFERVSSSSAPGEG